MRLFRTPARSTLRWSLLATLLAFAGCISLAGGDDDPITTGTVIVLAANQEPKVAVNLNDIQVVRIIRSAGYTGSVGLSIDSLPLGVTASFDPSALGGFGTTSILTLTAAANATAGTTLVKLKATGQNANVDSTNISITVTTGAIALATPTTQLSVVSGTTASIPLTLSRLNGFLGSASLTAEGLPSGVIATFSPALLPNGTVTSTLSLAVPAGTLPTIAPVTIRAKGTGVADKTVTVMVSIGSPGVADFALSASPASQSVVAGTSVQSIINVSRVAGFAGNVAFALSGLPTGATAVFTPNPATANTSTLVLSTNATAVAGDYNLTLTGTATTGGLTHSIPIALRLTPAPAIAVKLVPDSLRLAPSGFAQSAVVVTRIGGFTGDFTMTATGLPAGVTATFGSSVVTGTATTLTLSATSAAAAGVYNVRITATAGSDSGSATLVLTVGTAAIN